MTIHLGKEPVEKNRTFTTCLLKQDLEQGAIVDLCLCSPHHQIIGKAQIIDLWIGPLKYLPAMLLFAHHNRLVISFNDLLCELRQIDPTVTTETVVSVPTLIRIS